MNFGMAVTRRPESQWPTGPRRQTSPITIGSTAMKTIGLVGGVASGKSLVAQTVCRAGRRPARCRPRRPRGAGRRRRSATGRRGSAGATSVLAADGSVDRAAVAARVFATR